MSPLTHLLLSWPLANIPKNTTRRQRVLVTVAGIIPDLDGLGYVPDQLTRQLTETPTDFFHQAHHVYGHNLGFALLVTAACALLAGKEANFSHPEASSPDFQYRRYP